MDGATLDGYAAWHGLREDDVADRIAAVEDRDGIGNGLASIGEEQGERGRGE
jgi:hypothetical protein